MTRYYFSDNSDLKSEIRQLELDIFNTHYIFNSDNGVFSKNKVDDGTIYLLQGLAMLEGKTSLLDIGSGLGVISIVANKSLNYKSVTGIEINTRAYNLSLQNNELNKTSVTFINQDGLGDICDKYDVIISNPPIRTGKDNIYNWFKQAKSLLNPDGKLVLVIRKQQGAESAMKYCQTLYTQVDVLLKKKGYVVFSCTN